MNPSDWWAHDFGFMWIMPLLLLTVFLFFMRGLFGWDLGSGNTTRPGSAREILDRRFACGEIGKDEYEDIKKVLGDGD